MKPFVMIQLPQNPQAKCRWILFNPENQQRLDGGELAIEECQRLKPLSQQYPCWVVAPGECFSYFRHSLPSGGRQASAALRFELEESIAANLESTHIAHEAIKADQPFFACAVDRDTLQSWCTQLDQAGLKIRGMAPTPLFLPDHSAVEQNGIVHIRSGDYLASLEVEQASTWWQLGPGKQEQQLQSLSSESGQIDIALPREQLQQGDALVALARDFSAPGIQLLSGEFALSGGLKEHWLRWRWPAIAASACMGLLLASVAADNHHRSQQLAMLDDEMRRVYRQTFPEQRRVIRPYRQMQSYWNDLDQAQDTQFLSWLQRLAKGAETLKGDELNIKSIDYRSQPETLKVSIGVDSFDTSNRFSAALEQSGLNHERGSFRQNGDEVTGDIVVRGSDS